MKSLKWIPVAMLLTAAGSAWSAPSLTLSGPASITAGQRFTLDVKLTVTANDNVASTSVYLQQTAGTTSDVFTITAWDHSATPFTNLGTPSAGLIETHVIPSSSGSLTKDLGGAVVATDADGQSIPIAAPGTYTIATLTLTATSSLQAGQYTIASVVPSGWGDSTGFSWGDLDGVSYSVTAAVPEPACLGLLGAAGLLLLGGRERRVGKVGG